MKKHLVPYSIKITNDEIIDNVQELTFVVEFGRGFLKRKYFTTIGEMRNPNPLNVADLEKLLSLTRISTFPNGYGNAGQGYYFVQLANPDATKILGKLTILKIRHKNFVNL